MHIGEDLNKGSFGKLRYSYKMYNFYVSPRRRDPIKDFDNTVMVIIYLFSQVLPRAPRLCGPAVACPECGHANDETFNFCQMCGYKRKRLGVSRGSLLQQVNVEELDARITQLQQDVTKYKKQKSALQKELEGFLASLPQAKDLMSASPQDVLTYKVPCAEGF